MTGRFISFEGGEGSGKSTQLQLLRDAFTASGLPFESTREPGGTPGAEQIRNLLVTGDVDAWDAITETLLFYAARADHVARKIKPALAEGRHVICDRFADSTFVYQGVGKGLSVKYVQNLHHMTLGNFMPHLTVLLDIDPAAGLARAASRRGHENRFEEMDISFHQNIRAGFLALAKREPGRIAVLDATQDKAALHQQIVGIINSRLGLNLRAAL